MIDARGLVVLPGAIDPHAHFEDPGHTEREDFTTGTMAAAAGGFTTVFEHPLTYPPVTTVDLYTAKRDMAAEKVVIDFGLWGALTAPRSPTSRASGARARRASRRSCRARTRRTRTSATTRCSRACATVAGLGGLVLIHAENDALLHGNIGRLRAAGRTDMLAHHESRPPFVEEEAVHRALFLAAHAGVRVQIVHISTPVSAGLVAAARARGVAASAEVCPHHLLLDLDDAVRLGPLGLLRAAAARRARSSRAVGARPGRRRRLPGLRPLGLHARGEGARLGRHLRRPLGCQVIQETVPVVLSEAVHRRGMALDAFARFSATNAARILGLYPRKGTIRPGADADLAIWDLDAEWTVDPQAQQFSKNPWSPFAGRRCAGASCGRSCAARRSSATARSASRRAMGGSCPRRTPPCPPRRPERPDGRRRRGGPGDRGGGRARARAPGGPDVSARVAYVAGCLLNANAKVDEWAPCAGVHRGLLDLLRGRGFALRQLPCPELGFAGLNRFWQVREQYDTPAYRRHCAALAAPVAELVAADLAGGADVVLIGVDGSPSMGVRLTVSGPDWGGRPDKPGDFDGAIVPGRGIFVEVLLAQIADRGVGEVAATAVGMDLPDYDEARSFAALAGDLDGATAP